MRCLQLCNEKYGCDDSGNVTCHASITQPRSHGYLPMLALALLAPEDLCRPSICRDSHPFKCEYSCYLLINTMSQFFSQQSLACSPIWGHVKQIFPRAFSNLFIYDFPNQSPQDCQRMTHKARHFFVKIQCLRSKQKGGFYGVTEY